MEEFLVFSPDHENIFKCLLDLPGHKDKRGQMMEIAILVVLVP